MLRYSEITESADLLRADLDDSEPWAAGQWAVSELVPVESSGVDHKPDGALARRPVKDAVTVDGAVLLVAGGRQVRLQGHRSDGVASGIERSVRVRCARSCDPGSWKSSGHNAACLGSHPPNDGVRPV